MERKIDRAAFIVKQDKSVIPDDRFKVLGDPSNLALLKTASDQYINGAGALIAKLKRVLSTTEWIKANRRIRRMMNISLAIMIDHKNRCIIYGELAIITQLGQYFGLETRSFTLEQDFVNELQIVIAEHPEYVIRRAPEVFAKVLASKTEIK